MYCMWPRLWPFLKSSYSRYNTKMGVCFVCQSPCKMRWQLCDRIVLLLQQRLLNQLYGVVLLRFAVYPRGYNHSCLVMIAEYEPFLMLDVCILTFCRLLRFIMKHEVRFHWAVRCESARYSILGISIGSTSAHARIIHFLGSLPL